MKIITWCMVALAYVAVAVGLAYGLTELEKAHKAAVPESNNTTGWRNGGYNGWQVFNDQKIDQCYKMTARYFNENKDAPDWVFIEYYEECLWSLKVWI